MINTISYNVRLGLSSSLMAGVLLAHFPSFAAVIINNNFDAVTTGSYTPGTAFGTDPELGNLSGSANLNVQATGGVDNSGVLTGNSPTVRSRSTAPIQETTSFSMYFLLQPSGSVSLNYLGAGWALAAGADGANFSASGNTADRFMVGIGTSDSDWNNTRFATFGRMASGTYINSTPSTTLAVGNWYQLSFDLTYDGINTWIIEDLVLRNWGANGVTGGNTLMSMASTSITNPSHGQNVQNSTQAYAYFAANQTRATATLDNLYAANGVVPEPGTTAFLLFGLLIIWRRLFRVCRS